ncbi:MAG TPA: guanylate kinase [Gemmatimonadaceae bacterium]|nr:guanylate kinase [Gemmatimonadaceae bacterium]
MSAFPVILSAPSGGGKTSIAHRLLEARGDVGYSVSCTTRPPRPGERHGVDYYFLSPEEFLRQQARGEFAESAEVHGHLYGTLRSEVQRVLGEGKCVLMDIDVQGAMQFRRVFPDAVLVFVLPPSAEQLLQRLRGRGTENAHTLAARLASALVELQAVHEYQYVIVNDDLQRATDRVSRIIDAEGSRRERLHGLEAEVRGMIERLEREVQSYSNPV